MESLTDRAHRVLQSHGGPVVPLSTLVQLLRADGCAVTEWVLLRALRSDRAFRLFQPWRGPLAFLAERDPEGPRRRKPGEPDLRHVLVLVDGAGRGPTSTGGSEAGTDRIARRVRRSLVLLGRALDEHSLLDRARWLRMLAESGTLRFG